MSFKYDDLHGLKALIEEGKCFQTLDQLCQPWIQLLFDFDDNIIKDQTSADWSWDHINSCTCLKYRTPLSVNFTSSIHRYSSNLLVFCFYLSNCNLAWRHYEGIWTVWVSHCTLLVQTLSFYCFNALNSWLTVLFDTNQF